jgi:hypothetical protein
VSRPIAVIDCETDPFRYGRVPVPFLWGWYDGKHYESWPQEHLSSFIEFISKQKCIVYAHNGGKFDYHFLKPHINADEEIMIINGRLARFKIGQCEFRDSWNIIPAKLASYQKTEINYDIFEKEERYKSDNWREIQNYLRDDCVNLYDLVSRFIERFGLRLTQAGASMNEWKSISNEKPENSGEEFFKEFQPYYYGGRVQCFRHGVFESAFKVLDINSAYPYAMLHDHPRGLDYERSPGYNEHGHYFRLCARSTGAFPYRDQESGKLEFPADTREREFFVTAWELRAALDTGTLHRPRYIETFTFKRTGNFEAYIRQFYEERLKARAEGDKIGDLFAKLFMNSLYGKWAANPDKYKTYQIVDAHNPDSETDYEWLADFGGRWLESKPLDPARRRYYNVATAASITGFVRAMLWQAICSCGADNILYCDTDSLATARLGTDIQLGTKLGQWKDEGDFVRAGIAGKKLYVFERAKPDAKGGRFKTAAKGVRLTPENIFAVAGGEAVTYNPDVPTFSPLKDPHFTPRKIVAT